MSEVEVDPMEGEQTWPTEEELAETAQTPPPPLRPTVARRVPRGTSDYQAAWIVEDSHSEEVSPLLTHTCPVLLHSYRYTVTLAHKGSKSLGRSRSDPRLLARICVLPTPLCS